MRISNQSLSQFSTKGALLFHEVLAPKNIANLKRTLSKHTVGAGVRGHNLSPDLRTHLSNIEGCRNIADTLCGAATRLVRIIVFNKTPKHNWSVPWHQDRTIAVAKKHGIEGYRNWTQKDGVWHVEPPEHILKNMVTLRVGLDDCSADNGPLMIIPSSHKQRRDQANIKRLVQVKTPQEIIHKSGDIFAMRPLLVHASRSAKKPSHRRVIHLEYVRADTDMLLPWEM